MLSEAAVALSSEATPKIVRLTSSNGRRPKRSPIGPADSAPTMMPMLDHMNAMVNIAGGRCHSLISDGTAQATDSGRSRRKFGPACRAPRRGLKCAESLIFECRLGARQRRSRHVSLPSCSGLT